MKNQLITTAALFFPLLLSSAVAQEFRSPEVHSDGSVSVRLRSKRAHAVSVNIAGQKLDLVKGDGDVWSVTSAPLAPGIHDYSFSLDGTRVIDPSNRNVKKWFTLASMVEVPSTPPLLTEFQEVPHGVLQKHIYLSSSVGHSRPVIVYTPPGYEESGADKYPLVLLLHGFGDDESAWTEVGRAHLIADNLIAQQKIQPCLIAMSYGHPVPPPFGKRSERPKDYSARNNDLYEKDIVSDLLPYLESKFRIDPDVSARSIVGLSMGGGHAIHVGLRHTDKFNSIGAFSAAAPTAESGDLSATYPALYGQSPAANQLKNFWIPIGKNDFLLERNESFTKLLEEQSVSHKYTKTEGSHSWDVWRKYLPEFLAMVLPQSN